MQSRYSGISLPLWRVRFPTSARNSILDVASHPRSVVVHGARCDKVIGPQCGWPAYDLWTLAMVSHSEDHFGYPHNVGTGCPKGASRK